MIKIRIMVLDQSWLLMETSVVSPNKERLFLEVRNKVGLPLILTKVFRSENMLHQSNQLSNKLFAANHPGTISEQFSNLVWNCSCIFLKQCPSTRKILCHNATIINVPVADITSFHSLLCFVAESFTHINLPTPPPTFDQSLYVKVYEIVSTKNMKIFIWLGGFHQWMSFLGSIGCLMEGSGLWTAPECVYVHLTVGHMFSRKAYACAVRGHVLCASAVLSLLLEDFWLHWQNPSIQNWLRYMNQAMQMITLMMT